MEERILACDCIVPEIGQWLTFKGIGVGQGKVTKINHGEEKVIVDLLGDLGSGGPPITEEIFYFHQIEGIIIDPGEIKKLEEKLAAKF